MLMSGYDFSRKKLKSNKCSEFICKDIIKCKDVVDSHLRDLPFKFSSIQLFWRSLILPRHSSNKNSRRVASWSLRSHECNSNLSSQFPLTCSPSDCLQRLPTDWMINIIANTICISGAVLLLIAWQLLCVIIIRRLVLTICCQWRCGSRVSFQCFHQRCWRWRIIPLVRCLGVVNSSIGLVPIALAMLFANGLLKTFRSSASSTSALLLFMIAPVAAFLAPLIVIFRRSWEQNCACWAKNWQCKNARTHFTRSWWGRILGEHFFSNRRAKRGANGAIALHGGCWCRRWRSVQHLAITSTPGCSVTAYLAKVEFNNGRTASA